MLIGIRILALLGVLTGGFFFFRHLLRSGKARRMLIMEEYEKNIAALQDEERAIEKDMETRRNVLRDRQMEIEKELNQQ